MKKILFILTVCLAFISVIINAQNKPQKETAAKNYVEVIYFHSKQRCATCIAIEKYTQEAIHEKLANQIKNGEVVFKNIDISQKNNQAIAEKYKVTWSSLFIVKHKNGKETSKDMTTFAFGNARTSPDKFKAEIINTIKQMLK